MEYKRGIYVSFGCCNQCNVIVSGVDEADSCQHQDRRFLGSLSGDDFVAEIEDFITPGGVQVRSKIKLTRCHRGTCDKLGYHLFDLKRQENWPS